MKQNLNAVSINPNKPFENRDKLSMAVKVNQTQDCFFVKPRLNKKAKL